MPTLTFETEAYRVTIRGLKPGLILNNAQTADPDNEYALQLQSLKERAKRAPEAAKQRQGVEYMGCLYTDEFDEGGKSVERVVLPQPMLQRIMYSGCVKVDQKKGKGWSNGITVLEPARLIYEGEQDVEKLAKSDTHVLRVPVKQGQVTIVRTRPCFKSWSATFDVEIETDFVSKETLETAILLAGRQVGCGDWRPDKGKGGKYGRFRLESIERVDVA